MPTFGTPTFVGRQNNGGSIEVPVPTDLKPNDLLVIALRSQDSTVGNEWRAPADQGFVQITPEATPTPGTRIGAIFVKTVVDLAQEPAVYSFTGAWNRAMGLAVAMTPDSEDLIQNVSTAVYGGTASSGGVTTLPAHTNTAAPAISLIALGSEQTANNSMVPLVTPAGFTMVANVQSTEDLSVTRTVIWLGWRAEEDVEVEALTSQFQNGSGQATYMATFTGGRTAIPEPVEPPEPEPGFRSVAQMLATPGATWAHRGGSANWPEMSEVAYRNAALAGYGALEFSCQRTVDGVWIGLHDYTLDRTSGVTGLLDVRTMTWAQVQEYRNVTRGGNEPYWRMTDFLDTYASTHVVIMDIKNGWANAAEWFSILDSYTNDRQRIIIKYFGSTSFSGEMANLVRSSGYSSWGYYYPDDVSSGALDRTQGNWSILGMEYGASQADWDAILAYGKPVVGHIIQSSTSANMALTKGAHMLQCANVASIPAVGPRGNPQAWDAVYSGVSRIPSNSVYVGTQKVWPSA